MFARAQETFSHFNFEVAIHRGCGLSFCTFPVLSRLVRAVPVLPRLMFKSLTFVVPHSIGGGEQLGSALGYAGVSSLCATRGPVHPSSLFLGFSSS